MSYPNRDLVLTQNEQHKIRKLLGEVKPIAEFLGKAAEKLKDGKGWIQSLTEAEPWLKDVAGGIAGAVPMVNVAVKLIGKWLEQTHPFELGAVACTLAYQQAAAKAIEKHWTSAIGYNEAKKVDDRAAERIRALPPAEAADLSTFTRSGALQHAFVRRADEILEELMQSGGFDSEMRRKVFDAAHDAFIKNLDVLLSDKKTAEKFAPFKDWMELDGGRNASLAALQIHAKYQRDQYESEPLFKREPYALKNIYVQTECGKLNWKEIRGQRDARRAEAFDGRAERCDPFSENHGGRHNLLETVMGFITDKTFSEPIVIQGVAGAGKSSFTLRLCAELWAKGFHPIRIRLKRLQLGESLIDALNKAIELADEDKLADLPIDRPDDLLLKGDVFKTPYGGERAISRYVVILDGWDELEMSDSKTFREKVSDMLYQVRKELLEANRSPRVRVIITGRPSPDVTESKFLRDDTPVLTMRPIRPEQLRKFVADLDDALGMTPPYVKVENPEVWRVPHSTTLEQAFGKYEKAFNQSLPKYDEQGKFKERGHALSSSSLEVLGLPLLAYLTIRVLADVVKGGGDLKAQQAVINEMVNNPTLLYRRLTDLTCEKAGKAAIDDRDEAGDIRQQAREVGLNLRRRLQRTAAAMSVLGEEHISKDEWSRRVPEDEDDRTEQRTNAAEDHPLSRLMISFYFKGGQPEQGCEFAHKSFREYLFAECIVETMKEHAERWSQRDIERLPARRHWRDFSESEDGLRYQFSRDLAELLAPQWLMPNVLNHLRQLIEMEIARAGTETNPPASESPIVGLQTSPLNLERWKWLRDVLADLWEWWTDGAHLRPQFSFDRRKGSDKKPAFVEELIRHASRLSAVEDDKLELESSVSMDAHLGEGLCELCALTHFYVATAEGWEVEDAINAEVAESGSKRKFQQAVTLGERGAVLFAPGSRAEQVTLNSAFRRYIARINAAFDRPRWDFPGDAFLSGAILDGARLDRAILVGAILDRASLVGASLVGASLDRARLDGASLYGARYLTLDQIKSAWIDEDTTLPEELEKMKPQLLEWQRKGQEDLEREDDGEEFEFEEAEDDQ